MAYTVNDWKVGDPITQEKMNHLETGVFEAHSDIAMRYTKTEVEDKISIINAAIGYAQETANNARTVAD